MYTVCKSHPLCIYNTHRWSLIVLAPEFQCRIHQSYHNLNCQQSELSSKLERGCHHTSRDRKSTSDWLCCGPLDWMSISSASALGAFLESILKFSLISKELGHETQDSFSMQTEILTVYDWIIVNMHSWSKLKDWYINRCAFSEPDDPCLTECPVDIENPTNLS